MSDRTCSRAGCEKPHRARGLCSTHYNQEHQPGRHKTITVLCGHCGRPCEKAPTRSRRYKLGVFCSFACRDAVCIPGGQGRRCQVYFDRCLTCERWFATRKRDVFCCSSDCSRTLDRLTRPPSKAWTPAEPRAAECAWCGQAFSTVQPARVFCSKTCRARAGRLRSRVRGQGGYGSYSWLDFTHIAARFGHACAYCGDTAAGQIDPDHVVPLSRGGPNTVGNLLPACRPCNNDKRDLLLEEWAEDRLSRGLSPRLTSWAAEDRRFQHLTSVRSGQVRPLRRRRAGAV